MKKLFATILTLCIWPLVSLAEETPASEWVNSGHLESRLVLAHSALVPGEKTWLALDVKMEDGWHIYWQNAGESGLPPAVELAKPEGISTGPIHWPTPIKFETEGIVNYGYHGQTQLLIPLDVSKDIQASSATVQAKVDYLVCENVCVPEFVELSVVLPVAKAGAEVATFEDVEAWEQEIPTPLSSSGSWDIQDTHYELFYPLAEMPEGLREAEWVFYPLDLGVWKLEEGFTVKPHGDYLNITGSIGLSKPSSMLKGVLVGTGNSGQMAVQMSFEQGMAPTASESEVTLEMSNLIYIFVLAIFGGVILNLMPCVFPVLSLKALSLTRQAAESRLAVRLHGLAYTLGVVLCFALLAAVLLALRAGGEEIGWGFQLQSPAFVASLALLFTLLGLNLSGMFEWSLLGTGAAARLTGNASLFGSFATGFLAAVVATPCTAPFMGTALGIAVTLPYVMALSVFIALGLGLALPFLIISLFPALVRFLPRPGAWMDVFKQFLAFPLYATAAWLVWVLAQQASDQGVLAVGLGMVWLAFAIWMWNLLLRKALWLRAVWLLVAGAVIYLLISPLETVSSQCEVASDFITEKKVETFTPEKLSAMREVGQPVFVNATAAWCITCQVNERTTLGREKTIQFFDAHKITYMVADWTNQDPAITQWLAEFGRNGVPLYVYYPPNQAEPVVLPQLLTPDSVIDAVTQANGGLN